MPGAAGDVYALWSGALAAAEMGFRGGLAFCTFDRACGTEEDRGGGLLLGPAGGSGPRGPFDPPRTDRAQGLSESFLERVELEFDHYASRTARRPAAAGEPADFGGNPASPPRFPRGGGSRREPAREGVTGESCGTFTVSRADCSAQTPWPAPLAAGSPPPGAGGAALLLSEEGEDVSQAAGATAGSPGPPGAEAPPGPAARSQTEAILLDALARVTELERRLGRPQRPSRASVMSELREAKAALEGFLSGSPSPRARARPLSPPSSPQTALPARGAPGPQGEALAAIGPPCPRATGSPSVHALPPPSLPPPRQAAPAGGETAPGKGAGLPGEPAAWEPVDSSDSVAPEAERQLTPPLRLPVIPGWRHGGPDNPQVDLEELESLGPSPARNPQALRPASPPPAPRPRGGPRGRPASPEVTYNAAKAALRGPAARKRR